MSNSMLQKEIQNFAYFLCGLLFNSYIAFPLDPKNKRLEFYLLKPLFFPFHCLKNDGKTHIL